MKIEEKEGVVIVRLEDDLLQDVVEEFEKIMEQVYSTDQKCVIIDFEGVEFVSSQCLRTITKTITKKRESGGDLVFVNPTDRVRQLCKLTRLDWIIKIFESEKEAIKIIKNKK